MKRTTADANDSNRYTEGNPSLGIPATVVGAEEMNNIQEELCNVVEAAGITLDGSVEDQVLQALQILIAGGGIPAASGQKTQTINNNASAVDVTDLLFNSANTKAFRVLFDIHRQSSTTNADETGEIFGTFDPVANSWKVEADSKNGDAGVTWSISAVGQLKYSSTNYGGVSYAGTARFHNIYKLAL